MLYTHDGILYIWYMVVVHDVGGAGDFFLSASVSAPASARDSFSVIYGKSIYNCITTQSTQQRESTQSRAAEREDIGDQTLSSIDIKIHKLLSKDRHKFIR